MAAGRWAAQVMQCIHGLWSEPLQASMAPLASALQMGSKERAVYLGHKVLRGVKARAGPPRSHPRLHWAYMASAKRRAAPAP